MYHTQVTWPCQSSAVRSQLLPEGALGRSIVPLMDIYESNEEIVYIFDMPGIDYQRLEVEIQGRNLAITAPVLTINPQYCTYRYQERTKGLMGRVVSVVPDADPETVRAELRNGLLELRFQKIGKHKPPGRKIRVNVYNSNEPHG